MIILLDSLGQTVGLTNDLLASRHWNGSCSMMTVITAQMSVISKGGMNVRGRRVSLIGRNVG